MVQLIKFEKKKKKKKKEENCKTGDFLKFPVTKLLCHFFFFFFFL